MRKLVVVLLLLSAVPMFAATQPLFDQYEATRQALLKNSVPAVQTHAKDLATAARAAKQSALATRAEVLSRAANLQDARNAFAAVSDELIRFRDAQSGPRPAVAWCSMERKYWLQPKGDITNPYLDSMRSCGEFKR